MPKFRKLPETVEGSQYETYGTGLAWQIAHVNGDTEIIADRGDGLAPLGYEPVEAEAPKKYQLGGARIARPVETGESGKHPAIATIQEHDSRLKDGSFGPGLRDGIKE